MLLFLLCFWSKCKEQEWEREAKTHAPCGLEMVAKWRVMVYGKNIHSGFFSPFDIHNLLLLRFPSRLFLLSNKQNCQKQSKTNLSKWELLFVRVRILVIEKWFYNKPSLAPRPLGDCLCEIGLRLNVITHSIRVLKPNQDLNQERVCHKTVRYKRIAAWSGRDGTQCVV